MFSFSSKGNRANRTRRGLTLIEAAMVLTIMALVVAGVMLFYQNASTSQKISSASGQVSAVQQAVRAAYAGQSSYAGLTTKDLVGQMPTSMVDGDGLRNAFNGGITVAPDTTNANSSFIITFAGLPSEACLRMAAIDMGRAALGINVNAKGIKQPPLAPAAAQVDCANNNNSSVAWTLR